MATERRREGWGGAWVGSRVTGHGTSVPVAVTKVSKICWWAGSVPGVLGVPLDADDLGVAVDLDRFDQAVGRAGDDPQAVGEPVDHLVVVVRADRPVDTHDPGELATPAR